MTQLYVIATLEPWGGQAILDGDGDPILYAPDIAEKWSAEELATIGLAAPTDADPVPAGKISEGQTVQLVDGSLKFVHTLRDPSAEELVAYAADRRWRKEVGGIEIAGIPIMTDDRSKQMILGGRMAASVDPDWSTQWVGANGTVYPVDAAAMVAISDAVQAHVNGCFLTFATVRAQIASGETTTFQEIDAAFA